MSDDDDDAAQKFGRTLKTMRLTRGMTQADLAELAGLAKNTVSMFERGAKYPRPATIDALGEALQAALTVELVDLEHSTELAELLSVLRESPQLTPVVLRICRLMQSEDS